ncbi:MAG: ATP-binding cassette domain-containing protein [Tissierellia bacterium]|nr:ATP-binding cassette domain-containing protein [Tissierellia bacterium]
MIRLENVSKYYKTKTGQFCAVKDLNMEIQRGSLVGLIGPNGAGKSTTIKMMVGILTPTSGDIQVCGMVPYKNRGKLAYKIGVMFGNRTNLLFQLPLKESVLLIRDMYSIRNEDFQKSLSYYAEILEAGNLLEKPIRSMSLGQRIKSEILVTLLHEPEILVLDEPTIGLDIIARQNFRKILRTLSNEEKKTIILTSHDLVDVENTCDEVLLINKGEIFRNFNRESFKHEIGKFAVINVPSTVILSDDLKQFLRESNDMRQKLMVDRGDVNTIIQGLNSINNDVLEYEISAPSLEDIVYEDYKS